MKKATVEPSASPEKQLGGFISKFDPSIARQIRTCRKAMRGLLPRAFELVYDNYNFFVIGYGPTERASEAILSITANSKGVGLAFLRGSTLPDPAGLLQGEGKLNRFIRVPKPATLKEPAVLALIDAAIAQSPVPFPKGGRGQLVIKSVSARQRPRRTAG